MIQFTIKNIFYSDSSKKWLMCQILTNPLELRLVLHHLVIFLICSAKTKPVTSEGLTPKWLASKLGYFRSSIPCMHLSSFNFGHCLFLNIAFWKNGSSPNYLMLSLHLCTINCLSPYCSSLAIQIHVTGLSGISVHCKDSPFPSESAFSTSLLWTKPPLPQCHCL